MDYSKSTASCLCKKARNKHKLNHHKSIQVKQMILINFQAESTTKAKAKRACGKDNDPKGQKPQAGQAQDVQKAVSLHGSLRKPYKTAGLSLDVEHLTLL